MLFVAENRFEFDSHAVPRLGQEDACDAEIAQGYVRRPGGIGEQDLLPGVVQVDGLGHLGVHRAEGFLDLRTQHMLTLEQAVEELPLVLGRTRDAAAIEAEAARRKVGGRIARARVGLGFLLGVLPRPEPVGVAGQEFHLIQFTLEGASHVGMRLCHPFHRLLLLFEDLL